MLTDTIKCLKFSGLRNADALVLLSVYMEIKIAAYKKILFLRASLQ